MSSSEVVDYAQEIESLEQSNRALMKRLLQEGPTGWVTLFRVSCQGQSGSTIYADTPKWRSFDNGKFHLEGRKVISNLTLFREQEASKAFLVCQDYICDGSVTKKATDNFETTNDRGNWKKNHLS
ncbi:hypothetical protein K469DRAFT_715616 [Zopfia rhizophila CBS 207.26]|uniref:Uncharacterized protein n=1 Tax=Zopfia rhizophila CBS 207.26 TaxID=1314779 RepID=A0A6A6DLY6_9PEZI|nr:hypothetical protein K469DRAFT_715616 [Zopfia rhizophila CBS 207.26]